MSSHRNNVVIDDRVARRVEAEWKSAFPDATLLPVIGLPSNNNGVLTLTHTDGSGMNMRINGLPSKSPLANNALYSAEVSRGHYLNLYEIMLPDIPGRGGVPSTAEIYVNLLSKGGLSVAGVHFHWWGSAIFRNENGNRIDRGVTAIHHQASDISPLEFSQITIEALKEVMKVIEERTASH